MNVSKNHVVWAICHFAGLASAHDCTIMSSAVSGAQSSRLCCRTLQNSSNKPSSFDRTGEVEEMSEF